MRFIIGIQRNGHQLCGKNEPSTIVYDVAFWEDQSRSVCIRVEIISHATINILEHLDLISGFWYGGRSMFPFDWDQFLQGGGDLGNHHGSAGHHPFLPDQFVPPIQWSSYDDESSLVAASWDPKRNQIGSARSSIGRGSIRGSSHHKYIVHQVQLDQCSYQGFSKRKKDQSAAAKVRVELES